MPFERKGKDFPSTTNICTDKGVAEKCPISIKKCIENKMRLSRVVKVMKESVLQVSNNALDNNIVSRSQGRQELAHLVNNIRNV